MNNRHGSTRPRATIPGMSLLPRQRTSSATIVAGDIAQTQDRNIRVAKTAVFDRRPSTSSVRVDQGRCPGGPSFPFAALATHALMLIISPSVVAEDLTLVTTCRSVLHFQQSGRSLPFLRRCTFFRQESGCCVGTHRIVLE